MAMKFVVAVGIAAVAAAGLAVAGAALAQEEKPGLTGLSNGTQYTPENVDRVEPFGTINLDDAGTTPESVLNHVQGSVSSSQLRELQARCFVIRENRGSFTPIAQRLCENLVAAGIAGV